MFCKREDSSVRFPKVTCVKRGCQDGRQAQPLLSVTWTSGTDLDSHNVIDGMSKSSIDFFFEVSHTLCHCRTLTLRQLDQKAEFLGSSGQEWPKACATITFMAAREERSAFSFLVSISHFSSRNLNLQQRLSREVVSHVMGQGRAEEASRHLFSSSMIKSCSLSDGSAASIGVLSSDVAIAWKG